jgi:hypothetical protein
MFKMDNDSFLFRKAHKSNFHKIKNLYGLKKCFDCGFYCCICQCKLDSFLKKPKLRIIKELCPKCKLYLCDCVISAKGEKL